MLEQLNDEQLMSTYNNTKDINSQRAFEILYQRHKSPLFRFIQKSINNEQDTRELFQDLWFKVIRYKNAYDHNQKFTTWIYTIARRLLIDHYRKSSKTAKISKETTKIEQIQDVTLNMPDNEFEKKRMIHQLKTAIETLPYEQKETFLMRIDSSLSLKEIAAVKGEPVEKVKSQLRYAVEKLKFKMGQLS